jgi:NAD+ kinase
MLRYPSIAIFSRPLPEAHRFEVNVTLRQWQHAGVHIWLTTESAQRIGCFEFPIAEESELMECVDAVVIIGGDGTLLSVARRWLPALRPLIGVNLGRLGFLTDIPFSSMGKDVLALLKGKGQREERSLLEASVTRENGDIQSLLALNDMVINRGSHSCMIELTLFAGEEYIYELRADGLIICTPTGSTAYALSMGGSILAPSLPVLSLVPIAPHTLSSRPIIVSDEIPLKLIFQRGEEAALHADGQDHIDLIPGDQILIKKTAQSIELLHPLRHSYYAMLREKLHWSAAPNKRR